MTSTNTHIINVFAKKLEITKVSQSDNVIKSSSAVFRLYRKALQGETALAASRVPEVLPAGSYVLADTMRTNSEGIATSDISISKLENNEPYYLVETTAPDGYILLDGYLEVRAMTDAVSSINGETTPQDVWTKALDTTEPTESNTKWDPYILSNWVQNATIIVKAEEGLEAFMQREGNITYDHNEENSTVRVKYRIRNDAGVELPSTGGPGTARFYILGSILLFGAGALLAMRHKKYLM